MQRLLSSLDGFEAFGDLNTEQLAVDGVVLAGEGGVLDLHGGDVSAVGQNLSGHLAGDDTEVIVGDGERDTAAAGAEVFLASNNGNLLLEADVVDQLGIGGSGVVGRDVEHVAVIAGIGRDLGDVIGIGKGVILDLVAHLFEDRADLIGLELGVGLAGAVEEADILGIGKDLLQQLGLGLGGDTVGGAGDVGAGGAVPVVYVKGAGVVGDRGAEDGDLVGGGLSCQQGRGGRPRRSQTGCR